MTETNSSRIPQPPRGFRWAGVVAGIKESGKPDVSLIVSDHPVVAAGVYTRNQIVAAPVELCRERTPSRAIRAVVTNSGNANACTGHQGMRNAQQMCQAVAEHLGCDKDQVLVMSTGVIGHQLPMDAVRTGIKKAHAELQADTRAFYAAAEAIRTTDKDRKTAFRTMSIGGDEVVIAAMAKGAGMIAPNMATMLAVIMTDAAISDKDAQSLIQSAADISFNRTSVDEHTSTNDTLLLLASGQTEPIAGEQLCEFAGHLNDVCIELAKQVVADGEGATHVMAIRVHGAADDTAANTIAKTVGASLLVKTAITGGDPNWGRIVSAAGYAEARVDSTKTTLKICGETIYENGTPVSFDEASLSRKMKSQLEVDIDLQVGDGSGKATRWASDLTTEYVTFNSEYTT